MKNSRPARPSRGRDNREDRQMHKATCASCGKRCEVPFRPTGDKPVYCSDCFEKDSSPRGDRGRQRDRSERRNMYDAVCATCGKRCEVPFKPSSDKPIYCNECFDSEKKSNNTTNNRESTRQFEEISWKMDTIISLLEKIAGNTMPVEIEEPKVVKKAVAKRTVAKKAPAKKTTTKKVVKKTAKK